MCYLDDLLILPRPDDRLNGLGRLDIYVSFDRQGRWSKPVNLGTKINSVGNEYSPSVSPDGSISSGVVPEDLDMSSWTNSLRTANCLRRSERRERV